MDGHKLSPEEFLHAQAKQNGRPPQIRHEGRPVTMQAPHGPAKKIARTLDGHKVWQAADYGAFLAYRSKSQASAWFEPFGAERQDVVGIRAGIWDPNLEVNSVVALACS